MFITSSVMLTRFSVLKYRETQELLSQVTGKHFSDKIDKGGCREREQLWKEGGGLGTEVEDSYRDKDRVEEWNLDLE